MAAALKIWTPDFQRQVPRNGIFSHPFASVGFIVLTSWGCSSKPPVAEEHPPPATVKWEGPVRGALEEWTELVGTTVPVPEKIARITAPVEGRVISVFDESGKSPIVEGQRIEKGTVLAQLDPTVIRATIDKTEANQDVLKQVEVQAQIAVEQAAGEVERLRKLKADTSTLVSPIDRLKADFALKDAQSRVKEKQAQLVAGNKELDSLRAQLKLHTLSTPIAGRVGRALVVRGQTLAVGTTVAEVIDLDEVIDFVSYVPPSLVGKLNLGQPALTGGFDTDPAAPKPPEAEGQIVYIANQAEPETGNFVVKVRFANTETHLPANRVLRVRVLTKPGRECLSLRESAIQEDEEVPTVVVVVDVKTGKNDEGKDETTGVARRLNVVLGTRDRTLHQIEIVGLEDPEKDPQKRWKGEIKDALFVVEGGMGLQTGDAVKFDADED
ncbi:MAG TPA: efflux RND transporter periplasmic adaptor subunit [Fimbriiglobus sp.]